MTRFELNILGCGSAKPTQRHLPSCQVLNVRDNLMMIDCGEGAQLAMRRQRLKFSRLGHIFISHLHGDHCFGLPGLISTMALGERTGDLVIHILPDGQRLLQPVLDYFCREMPFRVRFNIISTRSAIIYEDSAITVKSFPLAHRVPCVGFLFSEKSKMRHINPEATGRWQVPHYAMHSLRQGKDYVTPDGVVVPNENLTLPADASHSYAYCSDTKYSQRVINAVSGTEWLYHEATYADAEATKARHRYHSTARQAAQVASQAGVRQLILGHYSSQYSNESLLLAEAREVFPHTRLAAEGMTVNLNESGAQKK